ncbi:MAG TPA: hypothetical protein VM783_17825 [Candidatus Acidoferrum sp.]|nr:hypothetical protein [Candidatus Acidoferrum sp.]
MEEFNYSFTAQEVNTLLAGLGELPLKLSWQLVNKLQAPAQTPVPLSDLGFTEV